MPDAAPFPLRRRLLLWAGVGVAVAGTGAIFWVLRRRQVEELRPLVEAEARRHGLPAGLVEAVVWAESKGDPRAVSAAQAYGLMQLRLPTARETAGRDVTAEELFDPALNLYLGCRYLRRMLERYHGDVRLALMAYNAGPGNVDRWLRQEDDARAILETLAFPETRAYVAKVLDRAGLR